MGAVIGFAVTSPALPDGAVWISGDTVLYDGVRSVAERVHVDVAVLHLGGVRFPITGPLRYTMTAADGIELCDLFRPRVAIPVHYEGWSHFRDGIDALEGADHRSRYRPTYTVLSIGERALVSAGRGPASPGGRSSNVGA